MPAGSWNCWLSCRSRSTPLRRGWPRSLPQADVTRSARMTPRISCWPSVSEFRSRRSINGWPMLRRTLASRSSFGCNSAACTHMCASELGSRGSNAEAWASCAGSPYEQREHGREQAQEAGHIPRRGVRAQLVTDQSGADRGDRGTDLVCREDPAEHNGSVRAEVLAAQRDRRRYGGHPIEAVEHDEHEHRGMSRA